MPGGHHGELSEFREEARRHKRAISVVPEKITPLPLDSNAPPPARLSLRRHSALESTIRDPSDYAKVAGHKEKSPRGNTSQVTNQNHNHINHNESSSPSSTPSSPREDYSTTYRLEFNNSFNTNFNAINNININLNEVGQDRHSKEGSKKSSPKTPRNFVDEDTINKFLTRKSDELLQSSTKDVCRTMQT